MQMLDQNTGLEGKGKIISGLMLEKLQEIAKTCPDETIRNFVENRLRNLPDTESTSGINSPQDQNARNT